MIQKHEKEGIIEKINQYLSRKPEISMAYLYGSYAKGNPRSHSDIDVAVYLDHITDIFTLEELKEYSLEELQKNRAKAWSVEHGLQLAIQLVIDTGNHILTVIGEQEIEDYVDVIDKLGERSTVDQLMRCFGIFKMFRDLSISAFAFSGSSPSKFNKFRLY